MSNHVISYLKSALIIIILFSLYSKTMAQTTTKINKITVAVFNEKKMKSFYENVFNIKFKTLNNPGFNLYVGDWGGLEIQFCPAEIAKNTAAQNRHQFHVDVKEMDSILQTVKNHGGSIIEDVVVNKSQKHASITDPDSNTIVLQQDMMQEEVPSVVGLGGIFFKSKNPEKLKQWYEDNLGIPKGKHGLNFSWKKENGYGHTLWNPFNENTQYFNPPNRDYMINYRVNNLERLLKDLKENNVQIMGKTEIYDYGKFAWILDLEGNKIELWEPNDEVYEKIIENVIKSN